MNFRDTVRIMLESQEQPRRLPLYTGRSLLPPHTTLGRYAIAATALAGAALLAFALG